ncbi:MAG: GspE/PulE family protein [Candidatus Saccharibacteria bacterium]
MKIHLTRKHLGSRLVDAGVINQEQLEEALRHQNSRIDGKGLLGQSLIELGYCSENDIASVVAQQAGVPYISLEHSTIDESCTSLISPEMARKYRAIPIGIDDNKLIVAMMRPNDIIAIDDLRLLTGYDIQPVMVSDSELQASIERIGRSTADVEQQDEDYVDDDSVSSFVAGSDDRSTKPAVQLANLIFNQAVRAGASDIHIEPQDKGLRVRFRIDGVLHDVMHPPKSLHPSLVSRIKVQANMDIAERRVPQDGRITLKVDGRTVDVRVASLPSAYGEKLTMRLLNRNSTMVSLDQLGFPADNLEKYRRISHLPYGFILVTGPTGSGKSTTLYATLSEINSVEKNIITLEDPIEYRLEGLTQVQTNPRAGLTFANGLRSILRSDPDVVMVGEIRDQETARIAVESALTGHLVLSTLHTNDAAGAITRLGDMGIEPFLTASALAGVIGQRLMRLLCPYCKEPYEINIKDLTASLPDFPVEEGEDVIELFKPKGCLRCSQTGYKGRIGVYELLMNSDEIKRMTLEHASAGDIKVQAVKEGMITFRLDGLFKAKQGLTSLEEVMRVVV